MLRIIDLILSSLFALSFPFLSFTLSSMYTYILRISIISLGTRRWCWKPVCYACSNKRFVLLGAEKPSRMCSHCFKRLAFIQQVAIQQDKVRLLVT